MRKSTCIIVEDEMDAVKLLQHYIEYHGKLSILGIFSSAIDARNFVLQHPVDLIFLDIELPGLSGIDFVKNTQLQSKIIFTTAFKEYAVEGFEVSATDYLLKPFSYNRFSKAMERFQLYPERKLPDNRHDNPFIIVIHERRPTKIFLGEILWAEAQRNYLHVECMNASYKIHVSISEFIERLPAALFVRVHRSFVISIPQIKSINSQKIFIKNRAIPVGRNYSDLIADLKTRLLSAK